jgi:uncharacterized cupredoxin-like copper-binding protein
MPHRTVRAALAGVTVLLLATGCATGISGGMMRSGSHRPLSGHTLSCSAPLDTSGSVVRVHLMDQAGMPMMRVGLRGSMRLMAGPTRVSAGRVRLVASNLGRRTHELVVLPLAPGTPAGQRQVVDRQVGESDSLGEASASCAPGEGAGIRPGGVGWVSLDLDPGRYELVCNRRGHYEAGMHAVLLVRP